MAVETSTDERTDQIVEQSKDERLLKIEQEISELKDGNDQTNETIENINGLLTREFAETLGQENAQKLLKEIRDKYPEGEELPDGLKKLIDFLEPIANPFATELKLDGLNGVKGVEEGQNPANTFFNSVDKPVEEGKESPKEETLNKIKKLTEEYKDISEAGEGKSIMEALNKIQMVLDNPTLENVKILQNTIYDSLNDENQKLFLRANKNKVNYSDDDKFDGKFGKSTLEWTNKCLDIMSNHLKDLKEANTVMDEHEQFNKDAEEEQKRIEAKKEEEEKNVNGIVEDINTNISKENEYVESLNIESVFADYPLKGLGRVDREINALKHIDDVQKQLESLKSERETLYKQLNTSKELLNSAQNRNGRRFAEKQIRTYDRQIHEVNLKYNELISQEDLNTPVEEKIRKQLNKIKDEYEKQFIKLDGKVKRLKGVDLSDFGNNLSEDAKKAILAEQENRVNNHKSEIDKYTNDMTKILSFLGSKYEGGKLVDDTNNTSAFEKFANKHNVVDDNKEDPVDVDKLNKVIEGLKDKKVSEFGSLDEDGKFHFNEGVLIDEGNVKYVKVGDEKFQLCDKDTKNINGNLVCIVSGGAIYFGIYNDGVLSKDGALFHSEN